MEVVQLALEIGEEAKPVISCSTAMHTALASD